MTLKLGQGQFQGHLVKAQGSDLGHTKFYHDQPIRA